MKCGKVRANDIIHPRESDVGCARLIYSCGLSYHLGRVCMSSDVWCGSVLSVAELKSASTTISDRRYHPRNAKLAKQVVGLGTFLRAAR